MEPGTVKDLRLGIPGPAEALPDDDDKQIEPCDVNNDSIGDNDV